MWHKKYVCEKETNQETNKTNKKHKLKSMVGSQAEKPKTEPEPETKTALHEESAQLSACAKKYITRPPCVRRMKPVKNKLIYM